jgi:predicted nucleotidyltransferase
MTKEIILEFLSTNRQELKERFGVKKIGLFGSYAREEATPKSDIDIAVEIESSNSFRSFFSLLRFLEDGLNAKIDLGIENSIKPLAKERIMKEIIYV